MKILTFTRLFPNRAFPELGIFVRRRLFAFARAGGHELAVVAPVPYFPRIPLRRKWHRWSTVPREETQDGVPVAHPRYFNPPWVGMRYYGGLLYSGSRRTVLDLQRETGFDLLDAHFLYPDGLAAAKLGEVLGIPVVITARGTDVNSFTQMNAIRPLILEAAGGASAVIAVSRGIADRLCRIGVPARKIHVIGNGVDAGSFHPRDMAVARELLSIPADARVLLCVSSLIEAKGHMVLLEALSLLRASGSLDPRLQLHVVGEGPLQKKMERAVRMYSLEGTVRLRGRQAQENMPWWYAAADMVVHPSFSEGCPNAVLEALSSGTPVVASAVGEIPRLLQEDLSGLLVAPGDPQELAEMLRRALKTDWNRSLIRDSVKALTWDAVARDMEAVYRSAAQGGSPAASRFGPRGRSREDGEGLSRPGVESLARGSSSSLAEGACASGAQASFQ